MKKSFLCFTILFFTTHLINAQFIKEKSITAQIGYGLTAAYDSATDFVDDGFFIQGEYVMSAYSWLELRPYLGLILTNSNGEDLDGNPTFERAETKAVLLGGKARVRAPIPYVAPYLEIGVGTSIGTFETFTVFDDIDKSGLIFHIPFSFGLELGKNNDVDLGLTYFFQQSVEQFAGAFALGITIPLKNKKQ